MTLLYIVSALFCGAWVCLVVYMQRSVASLPLLRDQATPDLRGDTRWPLLSIVVPACNEAEHIKAALTSLLAQDYPRFELVVVDDRSTDATGAVVDRLAAKNPRIQALHIEALPEGWLGKVNALNEGVRAARGDWYLFTDADVYFEPGALRRAVGYAERHGLHHLACIPEIGGPPNLWLEVVIRSFFLLFSATGRLAQINREDTKRSVGIGAFNLVQAAMFARTPGFEWLRMEPADDLGLGLMLKQAGARARCLNGDRDLRVTWYENVGALIRGLEKNGFGPGSGYSYLRQLANVVLLLLLGTVPALSLVTGLLLGDWFLLGAGGAATATTLIVALVMPLKSARDALAFVLVPAGVVLMALTVGRSAYKCLLNGGIDWRGTHYPVAELRRGQRVRF